MTPFEFRGLAARALAAATMMMIAYAAGAQTLALADLRAKTHIHGIAVDPKDGSRLYLATHHGFFVVSPAGQATRISRFDPLPVNLSRKYSIGEGCTATTCTLVSVTCRTEEFASGAT